MTDAKPHYIGHRQRLKDKLAASSRSLADYEIMELALAMVLPRRDTKPLAKELIARFGSFKDAIMARPDQLDGIKGIGDAVKSQWLLLQEIHARMGEASARGNQSMTDPSQIAEAAMARIGSKGVEEFWVAFLDTRNRAIAWEQVSTGSVAATPVFPREIVARALRLDASNVILVHNHPGGDLNPSVDDELLTGQVIKAAANLDVAVLDHIIVNDHDYFSFQEHGKI